MFMEAGVPVRWWLNRVESPDAELILQAVADPWIGSNQEIRATVSSSDSGSLQPNITDASIGNPFPRLFVTVLAYEPSFFHLIAID